MTGQQNQDLTFTKSYMTVQDSKNWPAGELVVETISANFEAMSNCTITIGNAINAKWSHEDLYDTKGLNTKQLQKIVNFLGLAKNELLP